MMFRWHRSVRRCASKLRVVKWQSWSRDGSRACQYRTGGEGEDVVGATAGVEFFQPLRRPAKDDQWQRDGFTMLMSSGIQEGQQGIRW